MLNRDAYKKKIYTELEIVQARFSKFKAQGQDLDTASQARHNRDAEKIGQHIFATRAKHNRHVEKVEQHIFNMKAKLKQLDTAHDDTWEELVDGVENTWTVLQSTLKDAVSSFKD